MKKISLLITSAACTILLLSSCSRMENFSVSKRHYRSGYYVDLGSRKQDVTARINSKTVTPKVTTEVNPETAISDFKIDEDIKTVSQEKVIPVITLESLAKQNEKKRQVPKEKTVNFYSGKLNITAIREIVKSEKLKKRLVSLTDAVYSGHTSSSDTPMWLLIVFAIILPPLAVGLKFGIVDKFWISVLLTLLFWIPGVIYALIMVTQ